MNSGLFSSVNFCPKKIAKITLKKIKSLKYSCL